MTAKRRGNKLHPAPRTAPHRRTGLAHAPPSAASTTPAHDTLQTRLTAEQLSARKKGLYAAFQGSKYIHRTTLASLVRANTWTKTPMRAAAAPESHAVCSRPRSNVHPRFRGPKRQASIATPRTTVHEVRLNRFTHDSAQRAVLITRHTPTGPSAHLPRASGHLVATPHAPSPPLRQALAIPPLLRVPARPSPLHECKCTRRKQISSTDSAGLRRSTNPQRPCPHIHCSSTSFPALTQATPLHFANPRHQCAPRGTTQSSCICPARSPRPSSTAHLAFLLSCTRNITFAPSWYLGTSPLPLFYWPAT